MPDIMMLISLFAAMMLITLLRFATITIVICRHTRLFITLSVYVAADTLVAIYLPPRHCHAGMPCCLPLLAALLMPITPCRRA